MTMELPELSLAPRDVDDVNMSMSESGSHFSKKRKLSHHQLFFNSTDVDQQAEAQTNIVDLHLTTPLPLDWEQCLDLQSGKMYYLNRKTLRKSWNYPLDQNLDLELNISSSSSSEFAESCNGRSTLVGNSKKKKQYYSSWNTNSTVALACSNCHLLVIISKSSPSCPNCKYVHSLPVPVHISTDHLHHKPKYCCYDREVEFETDKLQ